MMSDFPPTLFISRQLLEGGEDGVQHSSVKTASSLVITNSRKGTCDKWIGMEGLLFEMTKLGRRLAYCPPSLLLQHFLRFFHHVRLQKNNLAVGTCHFWATWSAHCNFWSRRHLLLLVSTTAGNRTMWQPGVVSMNGIRSILVSRHPVCWSSTKRDMNIWVRFIFAAGAVNERYLFF